MVSEVPQSLFDLQIGIGRDVLLRGYLKQLYQRGSDVSTTQIEARIDTMETGLMTATAQQWKANLPEEMASLYAFSQRLLKHPPTPKNLVFELLSYEAGDPQYPKTLLITAPDCYIITMLLACEDVGQSELNVFLQVLALFCKPQP
ncbi:MAG: hypothetical protein ACHQTE_02365 [Candidatus Saccharimonadales bacterium]